MQNEMTKQELKHKPNKWTVPVLAKNGEVAKIV